MTAFLISSGKAGSPNTDYARRHPEQRPADGERIPTLEEVVSQFMNDPGLGLLMPLSKT